MVASLAVFLAFTAMTAQAADKLKIVTTTEDLASLARDIGGELVDVYAIAKGYQDPHFVEAKPSHLVKLRKADLYIQIGIEMEAGWAPALLSNSRNPGIQPGRSGFLEAYEGCEILQKPDTAVDRSQGDVHPLGNPHFWTDPENGRVIARRMSARFSELSPGNAAVFKDNLKRFESDFERAAADWRKLAEPFKGLRVVTYHNSWPNFAKRFGLNVVNFIEPRPGVPPSPAHVRALIEQIRAEKIPLILMETYWDPKIASKIASESGANLVVFPASVGGRPHIHTYFELFEHNLKAIASALEERQGGR